MSIVSRIRQKFGTNVQPEKSVNNESANKDTQSGTVVSSENYTQRMYDLLYVSPDAKISIEEIRRFDRTDPRVKKIHKRMARDATKGGIRLQWDGPENKRIASLFETFKKRLQLNNGQKLTSDARGALIEGTLVMQWVVDTNLNVMSGLRMPSETIVPVTSTTGQFKSAAAAYKQLDPIGGYSEIASFAFWQISMCRLDPDNFDDFGSRGRPYLDAARKPLKQLTMSEDDLVIRRRTRAPQRFSHILEGADDVQLNKYKQEQEQSKHLVTTDFYSNHAGGVTALGGDAALDQIADVVHLMDTFFSGAPAPKGLFGYADALNRDILEDLKKDYYEEIDGLQDLVSFVYYEGFRLELLLKGINPDSYAFNVQFAERKTETRNQKADLALKYQALGVPYDIVWETAGLEPKFVKSKIHEQKKSKDPYPSDDDEDEPDNNGNDAKRSGVKITPGNAPKSESATTITNNTHA